jgi:thiol:disulfide interchange protein DsbD
MYIGQTGDVILGGSALFVMGFGMGVPLLIIGACPLPSITYASHYQFLVKGLIPADR